MTRAKLFLALLIAAAMGLAQAPTPATQPAAASAAFDKLKSLVGEWEGSLEEGGRQMPATTSFRLVSAGSVLMHILDDVPPNETVTMIHMDNTELMATHYCDMKNQPRFRFVPSSEPNVVTFEFKDATNLPNPAAPHMVGVKITFLDANHHYEEWTTLANGRKSYSRFDFRRKG